MTWMHKHQWGRTGAQSSQETAGGDESAVEVPVEGEGGNGAQGGEL